MRASGRHSLRSVRCCELPRGRVTDAAAQRLKVPMMPVTVLYPEVLYPDQSVEREVYGPDVRVVMPGAATLAELNGRDCVEADGLMIMRQPVTAADFARFEKLRVVVRMGVGYDRLDRKAAAAR